MTDEAPKAGDVCALDDGSEGVLQDTSEAQDGSQLTCVVKEAPPAPKVGDACTLDDGTAGVLTDDGSGNLVCAAPSAPAEQDVEKAAPEEVPVPKEGDTCDLNGDPGHLKAFGDGTLYCARDPKAGDICFVPDGREGVLKTLDDTGELHCLPNQDQG